ncbi:NAD(P)-dependent oxidoreductase [Desertimonas flava]|uniref:NAD(P)-dependent oxidoreductase n=1 Tax=Desertimonas flava TaxID=2064846 RepID=UPI000E341D59|nr:NAD(P)-binding domain-containing protein [Desertimonas flava]
MNSEPLTSVTVLGLGAMGGVLAKTLLRAHHPVTVWNRTPGRAGDLAAAGAFVAPDVATAVAAGDSLIVACLLDADSVHETLDPVIGSMRGGSLLNLTTTTPNQARELSSWAGHHGVRFLDGGIMATPPMIGGPGAAILYSGDEGLFGRSRPVLDRWGESSFHGSDAGRASLLDMAMLAGMYIMFGGFLHGAAMVETSGITATEFAARAQPFLAAMTESFSTTAEIVDARDYERPGLQSLEFSDLGGIVRATSEQGVPTGLLDAVQTLIRNQIDAGYGRHGFDRIFEELRVAR